MPSRVGEVSGLDRLLSRDRGQIAELTQQVASGSAHWSGVEFD